jgi:hypothetical protein
MWDNFLENPQGLRAIYKEDIPDLTDVELIELKISFGEDIQCNIRFNTRRLPKQLPEKWLANKVSIIHIELLLVNSTIQYFSTNQFDFIGNLEIEERVSSKEISFKSKEHVFFTINAKWLYLQSVGGFTRDQSMFNI